VDKEKIDRGKVLPKTVVLKFPSSTRILNIDIRVWIWIIIGLFIGLSIKVLFFSNDHFVVQQPPLLYLDPSRLILAHTNLMSDEMEISSLRMEAREIPATYNLWTQSPNAALKLSSFVLNQGPIGSCTANAMSYAWMLYKFKTWESSQAVISPPSRLFWYAEARMHLNALDGNPSVALSDTGCYVSDVAWVPTIKGTVPETAYPYTYTLNRYGSTLNPNSGNVNKFPPPAISAQAVQNLIPSSDIYPFYYSSNSSTTLQNMKRVLSDGRSILLGILVYSSFQSSQSLKSGNIPMPNRNREALLGGHCICLTGYDTACFLFRNSWGTGVGVRGAFRIPYAYITNPNLCGDAWIF